MMEKVQNGGGSFRRYVDILSDSGFKAVFGDENNTDVIIDFLNVVLPEERRVRSLTFSRTEIPGFTATNKAVRLDLRCESEDGTHFIVEMQQTGQRNFFRRCVQYAAKVYDSNSRSGDRHYDLPPVYLIGILARDPGFSRSGSVWDGRYISEYTFREKETHEVADETISIIFVELYRFGKGAGECRSDRDRWWYSMKHLKELESVPAAFGTGSLDRLFRASEIAQFDSEKRLKYEEDMISERDYINILDTAEERGLERGLEQGRAEGLAQGVAEGISKVARAMLKSGMDIKSISSLTGMTEEQIKALRPE